jgi:hypothetical protein
MSPILLNISGLTLLDARPARARTHESIRNCLTAALLLLAIGTVGVIGWAWWRPAKPRWSNNRSAQAATI